MKGLITSNLKVSEETMARCRILVMGWDRGRIVMEQDGTLHLKLTMGWPPTATKVIALYGAAVIDVVSVRFNVEREFTYSWRAFTEDLPNEDYALEHLEFCRRAFPSYTFRVVKVTTERVAVKKGKK